MSIELLKWGTFHGVLAASIAATEHEIERIEEVLEGLKERRAQFLQTQEHLHSITDPETMPKDPKVGPANVAEGAGSTEGDLGQASNAEAAGQGAPSDEI